MNDEQIIEAKVARYMAEAGGDKDLAMRFLAIDLHRVCGMVDLAFYRIAPLHPSRFSPKAQVEAIDIPSPISAEAANPSA